MKWLTGLPYPLIVLLWWGTWQPLDKARDTFTAYRRQRAQDSEVADFSDFIALADEEDDEPEPVRPHSYIVRGVAFHPDDVRVVYADPGSDVARVYDGGLISLGERGLFDVLHGEGGAPWDRGVEAGSI